MVIISAKLGLDKCNPDYLPVVKKVMQFPQFIGMIGGKRREALYFVGFHGDQLIHLDPHYTQVDDLPNHPCLPFVYPA